MTHQRDELNALGERAGGKKKNFVGDWHGFFGASGLVRFGRLGWRCSGRAFCARRCRGFTGSGRTRGFFFAIDERFQVEGRQIAIGNRVGTKAIEGWLQHDAEAAEIGFLRVGEAIGILIEDGLEAEIGFGLALRGKFGRRGLRLWGLQ